MLSYATVRNADLVPLEEAYNKWSSLPGNFLQIGVNLRTTVTNGLRESDWEGKASDAAFRQFTKIERQVDDAAQEAVSVKLLLYDALEHFRAAKGTLKRIEEELAGHEYLRIDKAQGIVYVDPKHDKVATLNKATRELRQAYKERITRARVLATDADQRLKGALLTDYNGAAKGFNPDSYSSLEEARKGIEKDAKKAVEIAKLGPDMSDIQLTQLNKFLVRHAGDPSFGEKFSLGMGPKGTLEFWFHMADPDYNRVPSETKGPRSDARLKKLAALQDNLSVTLASATQSGSPEMKQWKDRIIALGPSRIGIDGQNMGPYGFQVMSNLMREGEYEEAFLKEYGRALLKEDKTEEGPTEHWIKGADGSQLNFGSGDLSDRMGAGNDKGLDPMTGFMEALNHNPRASTEVLGDKKTFDYLLRGRDWPADGVGSGSPQTLAGHSALGRALESATTGHPGDAAPSAGLPPHSKGQSEIFSWLVHGIAAPEGHDDHIDLRAGMPKSLGQISAEYMPDINYALAGGKDGGESLSTIYPNPGERARFSEEDITRFLYDVGQDPKGYAGIAYGQTVYSSGLIDYHLANPEANGGNPANTVIEVAHHNAEIESIIGHARRDSDVQQSAEGDAKFNKELEGYGTWARNLSSVGVGLAVGGATSPLGGALAAVAADDIAGKVVEGIIGGYKQDRTELILYSSGMDMEVHQDSMQRKMMKVVEMASEAHPGGVNKDDLESAIRQGTETGNNSGTGNVNDYCKK